MNIEHKKTAPLLGSSLVIYRWLSDLIFIRNFISFIIQTFDELSFFVNPLGIYLLLVYNLSVSVQNSIFEITYFVFFLAETSSESIELIIAELALGQMTFVNDKI